MPTLKQLEFKRLPKGLKILRAEAESADVIGTRLLLYIEPRTIGRHSQILRVEWRLIQGDNDTKRLSTVDVPFWSNTKRILRKEIHETLMIWYENHPTIHYELLKTRSRS